MWRTIAALGFRRLLVFVQAPGGWGSVEWPADIEARELSADDIESYCQARPDTLAAEVRRRMDAGDRCTALWRGKHLVASRWISTGTAEIEYLGLEVRLAPGVEHHYDVHTVPDERRRRLQRLLAEIVFEKALEVGRTCVFCTVGPENRAMLAFLPTSARRVGRLASVRLGPWIVPVVQEGEGYLDDVKPIR
jgi:ribosomal protein S18 acetylase RimI-like enzyme